MSEREQNAAPQVPLAKSAGQIGVVQPVNGTDKPSEKGITPAGAAPSTPPEQTGETPRTDALRKRLYPIEAGEELDAVALAMGAFEQLERELSAAKAELAKLEDKQAWRNKNDPATRLHNLADELQHEKEDSPYSAKAWDDLVAENDSLRVELAKLRSATHYGFGIVDRKGKLYACACYFPKEAQNRVDELNRYHSSSAPYRVVQLWFQESEGKDG